MSFGTMVPIDSYLPLVTVAAMGLEAALGFRPLFVANDVYTEPATVVEVVGEDNFHQGFGARGVPGRESDQCQRKDQ